MPPKKVPLRLFNATKLKVNLRSAFHRVQLQIGKKRAQAQVSRRELATLLEKGKEESARIRVEHLIREDYFVEALEVVERYLELLLARFSLIESMSQCDTGISEAVHSLIWVAPRADIKELLIVKDHLTAKFGSTFAEAAANNSYNYVNPRISKNLSIQTPDPKLVTSYLEEIAKSYNVDWEPKEESPVLYDHSFQNRLNAIKTDQAGNRYMDASTHLPASLFDDIDDTSMTLPQVTGNLIDTEPKPIPTAGPSAQQQPGPMQPLPPSTQGPVQPPQVPMLAKMKMPEPQVDHSLPTNQPHHQQPQQPVYNPAFMGPQHPQPSISLTPPTPRSHPDAVVPQTSAAAPPNDSFDALQARLARLKQTT